MHPDIQVWIQIIVAVAGLVANIALIAWFWGKNAQRLKDGEERIESLESRIFPEEPHNRMVTMEMCKQCQNECVQRNMDSFKNIALMMAENNKSVCDIREAVGWIRGRMEQQERCSVGNGK